ncbi:MAG: ComF family protein [Clostridiaceae bacterium]|nr:ComF family protein [Eubacteriales bacterium]
MSVKDAILDAIFPKRLACYVCNSEAVTDENGVCEACAQKLRFCPPLQKLKETDGFAAGLLYTEAARAAMHRFKYGDAQYLAEFFASFLRPPDGVTFDTLVPVPIHKKRLRKRGYNQSALIAALVGAQYGIRVDETLLTRAKDTRTQTKLSVDARRKNVKGAFAARPCGGLSILLVDDVKTTGSTLSECAKTLKKAGAARVYALAACADELPYQS